MNARAPSSMPAGLSCGGANAASQHTRPDKKVAGVRTHRCEIRLTATEHRDLWRRAAGQELSSWLRALALDQPLVARRVPHRRRPMVRPSGSLAAQQQARALMSLAQMLGGLVDRLPLGSIREEAAALLAQVRRQWEGLHAHRDL